MGQIVEAGNGVETYRMVKALCDYVASDTFIGLDAETPIRKGDAALNNMIFALNDCTQ